MKTIISIIITFFIISSTYADTNTGLVGWWRMDEFSGNAIDSSGLANTGTVTGTTITSNCARYGCRNFSASGKIDLPALGTSVSGGNPRTISVWVNPSTATGIQTIYGSGTVAIDTLGTLHFNVGTKDAYWAGSSDDWHTPNNAIPLSTWTHVVFTYSGGTTSSSTVHIYINAVDQTLTFAGANHTPNTNNSQYSIGYDPTTAGRNFSGMIDDVKVYNRALSALEVTQLYSLGLKINNASINNAKLNF